MEITKAYKTLEKHFSDEFIKGRKTKHIVESAEKSWMMPLPWFYAAAAYARDNNKDGFKGALHLAANCYGEILARQEPERLEEDTELTTEAEAANTLARNIEQAWELIKR